MDDMKNKNERQSCLDVVQKLYRMVTVMNVDVLLHLDYVKKILLQTLCLFHVYIEYLKI